MARLLRTDGTEARIAPKRSRAGFTLDELYTLLACETVQCVPLGEGQQLVVDEDGKYKTGLRRNVEATKLLALAGGMAGDYVVGDALVVSRGELK